MPKCRRVPGFKVRLSMALGSGLVDNVPAHCRGVELDELYKAYDKAKMSYDSVNNFINQHLKLSHSYVNNDCNALLFRKT